jgi:hypothetical protein
MHHQRRWLTALAAVLLAFGVAGTAFGYAGQVAASVTIARPHDPLKCGVNITLSATVRDNKGKPISGQPVAWSFTHKEKGDKINASPTITNKKGVATTTVRLACIPGKRIVRATADAVSGTVTLDLKIRGLPNTSTLAGEAPAAPDLPLMGTFFAILALAAGGVITLRRMPLSRR